MQTRAFLRAVLGAAALVLLIAVALWGASVRKADAQSVVVGVSKDLCLGTNCGVLNVPPVVTVSYKITMSASGSTVVNVKDPLPPGFVVTGVSCSAASGTYSISGNLLTIPNVTVAPNTVCTVTGAFTQGTLNTTLANTVTLVDNANVTLATSNTSNATLDVTTPIPGNVAITKMASTNAVNVSTGAQTVTYTMKVTNTGTSDLVLGTVLRVEDRIKLRPNSVPLKATYVSSSCTVATAANTPTTSDCVGTTGPAMTNTSPLLVNSPGPMDFVAWRYPASAPGGGLLKAGDVMTLTLVMTIAAIPGLDCVIVFGADGIINEGHLALNLPPVGSAPATPISDATASDNTSSPLNTLIVTTGALVQDPACGIGWFPANPILKVTKTQDTPTPSSGSFPWGSVVWYKITVKNISATPQIITNLRMEDWVLEGPGTPPFKAQAVAWQCAIPTCGASPQSTGIQQLAGYSDIKRVFRVRLYQANPLRLAQNQSASFKVAIKYFAQDCDSYPGIAPKPIINFARVVRWRIGSTNYQGIAQAGVVTLMDKPGPCPLKVTKTTTSTKIRFNQPINYVVTYKNNDPVNPHSVGTVIDTVRIATNNYAAQLTVNYRYKCVPSGGVTFAPSQSPGWPALATTPLNVIYTSLPQQGVRVIQNIGPVNFPPLASLTCTVTLVVQQPPQSDPFCAMNGSLDNAGIIDGSAYYNPNLNWSNTLPGFWAQVNTPLPKCYDVILNKTASPLWTWQGGGPVTFDLKVSNGPGADPIVGGGPEIVDTISPPLTIPMPVPTCVSAGCVSAWAPPPPPPGTAGITRLRIMTLPPGTTQIETYSLLNTTAHPYPATGQICNDAVRTMRPPPFGPAANDYYWKRPSSQHVCIPVVQTGKIIVHKVVTVDSGYTAPATIFPITVTCVNGSYPIPPSQVNLGASGAALIQGIPVGSNCTPNEIPPPPIPTPGQHCQLQGWFPPTYTPSSLNPTTAGNMTITVKNRFGCVAPNGTVLIQKTVTASSPYTAPAYVFPITVSCQNPISSAPVNILGGATVQVNGLTAGGQCTTTEQLPGNTTDPVCAVVGWSPPVITPNPFTAPSSGTMTINVQNHYGCLSAPTGGTIYYKKSVTSMPGYTAPANATFPIVVQCQNGSNVLPPYTATVSGSTSSQINNVPLGSTCTTTETVPPPISTPGVPCQSIGWFPPVITPNPITSTTNNMTIAIQNKYGCLTPPNGTGNVVINKLVTSAPPWIAPVTSFTVTLTCPMMPVQTIAVVGGGTNQFTNIPGGFTCTVAEQLAPKVPTPACHHLGWTMQQIAPNPVVVPTSGTVTVTVSNRFECVP